MLKNQNMSERLILSLHTWLSLNVIAMQEYKARRINHWNYSLGYKPLQAGMASNEKMQCFWMQTNEVYLALAPTEFFRIKWVHSGNNNVFTIQALTFPRKDTVF